MQELTIQETIQAGGAASIEYSRMKTVAISALSAGTSAFACSVYTGGLTAFTTTAGISAAATLAVVAIPVTMGVMIVDKLYADYYNNRVTVE